MFIVCNASIDKCMVYDSSWTVISFSAEHQSVDISKMEILEQLA